MQAFTPNHWTKVRDHYGGIRGRIEGTEENADPIGKPAISANLDLWKILESEIPNKEYTRLD